MKSIKLSFKLDELPCYAISHKNGRKTFDMQAFDGEMSFDVQYDYDRRPLRLSAKVSEGDEVEVILMTHRIELYVDGILMDEEWPKGNRLFELGDEITSTVHISTEEYHELKMDEPSVLSNFENADGWYPGNGVFVGDCMPYRRDDEYHVLYLNGDWALTSGNIFPPKILKLGPYIQWQSRSRMPMRDLYALALG